MEQLYNIFSEKMYNTSFRLLNHQADAQDAMQDAFLAAWKAFPRFELSKSPEKWLKTLVINKSIDILRKRKRWKSEIKDINNIPEVSEPDTAFAPYPVEMVRQSVMNLPDACRTVVSLSLIEGLDYSEIADYLKLKESSVRSHVSRGLLKIRIELKEKMRADHE